MQVTRSNLNAIFKSIKMTFDKAFQETETYYENIAMVIPSTSKENNYSWLSKFPKMRKWIGDKQIDKLAAHHYTIVNEKWEATVEVQKDDIEDDNLGAYSKMAEQAGWSAKQLPDEIAADLLNHGFVNECYDDKPFFANDHEVNINGEVVVVSNKSTKAISASTYAKAKASYGAAKTAMAKQKDEHGRSLKVRATLLVVPRTLEDTAKILLESDKLEDGKQNPYKGTAKLLVIDDLTSDTAWFLLDMHMPIKPLIIQKRKEPKFVKQTDESSDDVFMRDAYKYGAEARMAGGYGFWQMAYGSTGTTA